MRASQKIKRKKKIRAEITELKGGGGSIREKKINETQSLLFERVYKSERTPARLRQTSE